MVFIPNISTKDLLTFFSRPRRKIVLIVVGVVWITVITTLYRYFNSTYEPFQGHHAYEGLARPDPNRVQEEANRAAATVKENLLDDVSIQLYQSQNNIKDVRNIDAHSSVYDTIFANHEVNSVLGELSFSERCDLYFTNLYAINPTWYLDPNVDVPLENRDGFKYKDFYNRKKNELKEAIAKEKNIANKDEVKEDDEFEKRMKEDYDRFWAKTQKTEQTIVDYLSHLRIYNKCYVTRDNKIEKKRLDTFITNQKKFISALTESSKINRKAKFSYSREEKLLNVDSFKTCSNLESKIYPWLSMSYPIFERFSGERFLSPPQMKDFLPRSTPSFVFAPSHEDAHYGKGKGGKISSRITNNNKGCFLQHFKNSLNGKGIVLSIADKHVDDTVRLISLLRALNNRYPIQIVYNGGLSDESKYLINMAAREPFKSFPSSFKDVEQYFPKDYLDPKDHGLPKQEVWFVNVQNVIQDQYKNKFGGFSNKFLAAMFNSFEEYLLVDADTVIVQNPDFFFNLKNYKSKGAYFYKDRAAPHFRTMSDCTFFKKITPSIVDQVVFDLPIITKKSLDLDFFDGMFYYMESGLVAINRNLHFNAIMMMIQMNFYPPVSARVYGDKEIFWLGFLAAGEENFHFNDYWAASIGEETDMSARVTDKNPKTFKSKEICAAHPGHVSSEDGKTLVWFNSGFRFCGQSKVVKYDREIKEGRRFPFLKTEADMRAFYTNRAKIRHAVIPPFKNKFETLCENEDGEPKEAWKMDGGYCNSYLWCAYSQIGGTTKDGGDNTQKGTFIEFDKKSVDLFTYYGDIWVGNE
ncbi:putative alpha-1,3-mannosyltransferase Mnn1p [[Candida] anglica]|uniref:Alpha-1,3-mannosyltransferase Mnn1p n=1 Tax=[Candida] anglica TaxID=148631 RepID=A0ABP0EGH8_9ASCO